MHRHIISMKSQGFFQTPQEIMEEYNGCSVPQYIRYPSVSIKHRMSLGYYLVWAQEL